MWFRRPSLSYTPPTENDSPFARARQEWDDRMGSCLVRARNWRAMAFASIALSLVLCVSLTWSVNRLEILPIYVPIDDLGKPGRLQRLNTDYKVEDSWVAYAVRQLVERVRSIPTDHVVLRNNWDDAYKFLARDAVAQMSEYSSSLDVFNGGRPIARSVEVSHVLKRSDSTLQVNWIEKTYRDGREDKKAKFTGLFTFTLRQPSTEQEAFDNPIGVFITNFSWSEEFDGEM